jgi:SulP family sulfate permease
MYTPKLFTELKTYTRAKAMADVLAGITVGIVALPLAMAFAIASGLPPERGLFTAIVAGFLISALGGSKVQIGGPTGAFVVLVSSVVAQFGYEGLAVCTILAGIFLVLFGIFRLGGLIRFIPFPVTTGFTTGIAVVIFSTQVRDLLGLRVESVPAEFVEKWHAYITHLDTLNPQAALLGLGTITVILLVRRVWPRLPAMLVGMLAATLVATLLHLDVETIGSRFGDLPRMLPTPAMPKVPWTELTTLIKPAFTIALLAAIESLLSATVADGMIGGRHRPNAELIGQGIANIGSILFGGIPATGAIARTATNAKSGGRTPVAGIVHAVVLALLLLLFAPLAKLIPLAALAGILVVVSYNMSERRHFASILRGPKSDAFVLVLTFLLTVLVDLTLAVQVGVVLAALLFIRRMAEIANVGMITDAVRGDEEVREDPSSFRLRDVPAGVEVFEVTGPFFFGMVDTFKNAMRSIERPPRVLVLRIRSVLAVDATAIHVLRELHAQCRRDHTLLVFSGVHAQPHLAFERSGFLAEIGGNNFLPTIDEALDRAREHLDRPTPDEQL